MIKDSLIALLATRRQAIEAELEKLSHRANQLTSELSELATAERVLGRLTASGSNDSAGIIGPAASVGTTPVESGKPPNTPTITEMIGEVLRQRDRRAYPKGMEPKDITAEIARRWWPNVSGVAISPIAWRMWKRHQLDKDGTLYRPLPVIDHFSEEDPASGKEAGP